MTRKTTTATTRKPNRAVNHPDDSTTNSIQIESEPVGRMGEADLKGHLLRVRAGPNSLVFIADTVLLIKNGISYYSDRKISQTNTYQ